MTIIPPHNNVSRPITPDDYRDVIRAAADMLELCNTRHGLYPSGYAVAHAQVSERPFRFFVKNNGEIVMNPIIIRKTKTPVKMIEGCLSYPNNEPIEVMRLNKCEVEYEVLNPITRIAMKRVENMSGLQAQIFQHEIDHMDGHCIYE